MPVVFRMCVPGVPGVCVVKTKIMPVGLLSTLPFALKCDLRPLGVRKIRYVRHIGQNRQTKGLYSNDRERPYRAIGLVIDQADD